MATTGDATWLHLYFDTALWATPGRVFDPNPSAELMISGDGEQVWLSTPELIADVQTWLDAP
jgi:hypothetical protein